MAQRAKEIDFVPLNEQELDEKKKQKMEINKGTGILQGKSRKERET